MTLEVNLHEVVEEVRAVFSRYEAALVTNDLPTLDQFFWDSPHTVRFGLAEEQYGFQEVSAFRHSLPRQTAPRVLDRTVVTTFGHDVATVTTEFRLVGADAHGRQSQTWVRTEGGWQIVSAHVSWPASSVA